MEPLRSWTIPGEPDLTITIHRPAVTVRCGDGPEMPLNPAQVSAMYERLGDADNFFDTQDPEVLAFC